MKAVPRFRLFHRWPDDDGIPEQQNTNKENGRAIFFSLRSYNYSKEMIMIMFFVKCNRAGGA